MSVVNIGTAHNCFKALKESFEKNGPSYSVEVGCRILGLLVGHYWQAELVMWGELKARLRCPNRRSSDPMKGVG